MLDNLDLVTDFLALQSLKRLTAASTFTISHPTPEERDQMYRECVHLILKAVFEREEYVSGTEGRFREGRSG